MTYIEETELLTDQDLQKLRKLAPVVCVVCGEPRTDSWAPCMHDPTAVLGKCND